jgi:hypothetical protein
LRTSSKEDGVKVGEWTDPCCAASAELTAKTGSNAAREEWARTLGQHRRAQAANPECQAHALHVKEWTMDRFMENFLAFEGFGPPVNGRDVPPEKIEKFRGKLPDKLLEYWKEYGWCGYAKGLLWTVDPDEWEDELEAWIGDTPFMERDAFYVIARTAFGELILWGKSYGQSLKVAPAFGAAYPAFNIERHQKNGPDLALQLFFSSSSPELFDIDDEQGNPMFEQALKRLGPLDHSTMYGFVPAIAVGGPVRLANLQKLDAHVHLDILSQMTELTVMRDAAQDAR